MIAYLKVDEDKAKELADAKFVANTTINNLKYLSTDAKSKFTANVAAAKAKDAIKPISEAAVKDEAVAKELSEAKDAALEKAKGYTHVSDEIKTTATTEIKLATSKDYVANLIAHLKVDEDKAKELADAKVRAQTTINIMKFLQAGQKANFVKQANSAKDMTALKNVIAAAGNKNQSESQNGTITFSVFGNNGRKLIKTVSKRIGAGNYSVTLKDLDVPGLTKSTKILGVYNNSTEEDLTGTTSLPATTVLTIIIKAQEDKSFSILTNL